MEECSLYNYEMVPSNPWTSENRRRRQGSSRPTVPSWEKKFCFSTCAISWKQLCDTKKRMSFFKNIAQWDDSSGEEAFLNAKARFWAEINGFPFDIPLPDPDIYTDEIDWNSDIDLELPLDLDKKPLAPIDEEKDEKLGWDSFNFPIPCTGWGDDEDPVNDSKAEPSNCPIPCTGWVDAEDPVHDSPSELTWGNFDQNVNNNIENKDVEQNSWENDGAKGQGNCDGNGDSDTWG
ncbi:uncharacterized protein LOC143883081 isoform X2 [Tasmannia lanceolata]|uniref:uncharacterized protein LOC143883081 isoform X2 n=1 Tax=Tasmannia lanceolata TaxID=3420 RepID=UPI0040648EC6